MNAVEGKEYMMVWSFVGVKVIIGIVVRENLEKENERFTS